MAKFTEEEQPLLTEAQLRKAESLLVEASKGGEDDEEGYEPMFNPEKKKKKSEKPDQDAIKRKQLRPKLNRLRSVMNKPEKFTNFNSVGKLNAYKHHDPGTRQRRLDAAHTEVHVNNRNANGDPPPTWGFGKQVHSKCQNCKGDESKWSKLDETGKEGHSVSVCKDAGGKVAGIHLGPTQSDKSFHRVSFTMPHNQWTPNRSGPDHKHEMVILRNQKTGANLEYCPRKKSLMLTYAHAPSQPTPRTVEHPKLIASAIRTELKNNPHIRAVHATGEGGANDHLGQVMDHLGAREHKNYKELTGARAWTATRSAALGDHRQEPKIKYSSVPYNHPDRGVAGKMEAHVDSFKRLHRVPAHHPEDANYSQFETSSHIHDNDAFRQHKEFYSSPDYKSKFKSAPQFSHKGADKLGSETPTSVTLPRATSPTHIHRIDTSDIDVKERPNVDGVFAKKHPASMPPLHAHHKSSYRSDDGEAKMDVSYCPYRKTLHITNFHSPSEEHSKELIKSVDAEAKANPQAHVLAMTMHPHLEAHMQKLGAKTVWKSKEHPMRIAAIKGKNFHEEENPLSDATFIIREMQASSICKDCGHQQLPHYGGTCADCIERGDHWMAEHPYEKDPGHGGMLFIQQELDKHRNLAQAKTDFSTQYPKSSAVAGASDTCKCGCSYGNHKRQRSGFASCLKCDNCRGGFTKA